MAPTSAEAEPPASVEIRYVKSLPGGRIVLPVERRGRLIWLVVEGHLSPQARTELLEALGHMTAQRLWQQNWGGSAGEPPQMRQVS